MTNHVGVYVHMHSYEWYKKALFVIDLLIGLVVFIIWTKSKVLSITLWLVYDHIKLFVI